MAIDPDRLPSMTRLFTERRCWSLCAVVALLMGIIGGPSAHQIWGFTAAVGYAAAALAARPERPWRTTSTAIAASGAVLLPLVVLVTTGQAQPEVGVVQRSAQALLDTGSPYQPEPAAVGDYNPYLPGMALLGLPAAVWGDGPLTDVRWSFAGVFVLALAAALRVAARPVRAPVLLLSACPLTALPMATGGIDLPVIGLVCLGLAFGGRGHGGRAGLALGAAAALKWTAWPALPVVLALLAVRSGPRPALRYVVVLLAMLVVTVVPVALTDASGLALHAVAFPLGLTDVVSPAASPLPGYLIANNLPGGTGVAIAALSAAAVGIGGSLVAVPPRSMHNAADRLAIGLGLAICLLPATRFGYLVYPFVLGAWLRLATPRVATPVRVVDDARPSVAARP